MTKRVFVMKYCLSDMIMEAEVLERDGKYLWVKAPLAMNGRLMFTTKEVAATKEEALEQYEKRKIARIKSLRKQIADLSARSLPEFDTYPDK